MEGIKKDLQTIITQQKRTNKTLDYWSYRAMFILGIISATRGKDRRVRLFGYLTAISALGLQILLLGEDIKEVLAVPHKDAPDQKDDEA